ncbi:MAG: hypothetical protein ACEQSU_16640 [Microgenomates group bacterium]
MDDTDKIIAAMNDLDFDLIDELCEISLQACFIKSDGIALVRVGALLLRGKVDDAEMVISGMHDKSKAMGRLDEWESKYAGRPHGQWKG